ncbi:MAG: 4-alpha-glucanotransferase [Clostridiaceae bacterium]|nr:4-alpha-glucanotransferase [Clostridiaceae bacterium]
MSIERSSGILLPISALPSKYGIGTLGKAAFEFIDFLQDSGQSWWQILPLSTTGYGNSPYQSFSAFAGNPYFIDLDILIEDHLLTKREVSAIDFGSNPTRVDYGKIYAARNSLLVLAAKRGLKQEQTDFQEFKSENAYWLNDFALFMVLKQKFNMICWQDWPEQDLRNYVATSVNKAEEIYQEDLVVICYIQFLFFKQWQKVREYAAEHQIKILGDIPLYVSLDSADVWSNVQYFQLNKNRIPIEVSGVPPDYFTADGQLWSNPLYDWSKLKEENYSWWIKRINFSNQIYDALRIDHFRGLESYWAIPNGEITAKNGRWVKGPGMDLISVLKSTFPDFIFIAEDLGYQTEAVKELLAASGFPGMNVLQLAFDYRDAKNNPLPHDYVRNSVCYVGTHDNAPIMLWQNNARHEDVLRAIKYFGLNKKEGFNWGFIRGGLASVSDLFIGQMQDFLGLAANSRMNTPGSMENNWEWRLIKSQLSSELAGKIKMYTEMFGRSNKNSKS